jgi:hypothetical protein
MAFRENLLQKIHIDRLADQVQHTMKPADPPTRIDLEATQALLQMAGYTQQRERDLDLYLRTVADGPQDIIVLDNEFKHYRTTVDDVALRKSPTIKEMVSIRNAIKILNDKDVVVSSKADTLRQLQRELIDGLDLSYTPDDIEALEKDGREALNAGYADGVIEMIDLFAELLGFAKAPKAFQLPHHHVWGVLRKSEGPDIEMGPLVLFSLIDNRLKMLQQSIGTLNKPALQYFQKVASNDSKADIEGADVLTALKEMVLGERPQPGSRPRE